MTLVPVPSTQALSLLGVVVKSKEQVYPGPLKIEKATQ
jgi:hypothetical protein